MNVLVPDLVYRRGSFEGGLAVAHDPDTGRTVRVGAEAALVGTDDARVERLPGIALLPGFVNAHSHAFQRLIRGRTQWRPAAAPDADFWSWREAMYAAALTLSPEEVEAVSRFCFLEMLRAGITAVGEFHYLHRDPDGRPYAAPNELAHRVIAAAEAVGIRIALLNVCYATGGIDEPLRPEQRRFATPDLAEYLEQTERLAAGDAGLVTVGVAPHSVRAVPRAWLRELHGWAAERDTSFHIHVSEQPAEVEACIQAFGIRPLELLAAEDAISERLTAVHATHLTDAEIRLLGSVRATVCACPTTERDLGDGFLPGKALYDAGAAIALGTDSHTVIDMLEEMRLVEYHERLRRLRRVVLTPPADAGHERLEVAPQLLEMATIAGARALRVPSGLIEEGALADYVGIDLSHHTLAGWTPASLPAMVALSAPADVVSDVWVGGARRVESRVHSLDAETRAAFGAVAQQRLY
jgi:formimidoylglutamate deiminase